MAIDSWSWCFVAFRDFVGVAVVVRRIIMCLGCHPTQPNECLQASPLFFQPRSARCARCFGAACVVGVFVSFFFSPAVLSIRSRALPTVLGAAGALEAADYARAPGTRDGGAARRIFVFLSGGRRYIGIMHGRSASTHLLSAEKTFVLDQHQTNQQVLSMRFLRLAFFIETIFSRENMPNTRTSLALPG